jgi:hypothetical protein
MKPPTILLTAGILVTFFQYCQPERNNFLKDLLYRNDSLFNELPDQPEKYRIQIIYTRIDREKNNEPLLTTFRYRVNSSEYFYPASTVKLPVALLALEKLNKLNMSRLSKSSIMITDSAYQGQTPVKMDTTAKNNFPSVEHYIKKIFLVSDNDAFNRLYEFLGPEYINETLHQKGYERTRIMHRLSIPLSPEENRYTNPVRFYTMDNQLIYEKELTYCSKKYIPEQQLLLGNGFISNDSLIEEPMDFSAKNFIPLEELHKMLISVVFPQQVEGKYRFDLTGMDRRFLLTYMSMYPKESRNPYYSDKYEDNYCKFLMYADREGDIPENIRIFNKIGLAYGFLIETAYIVDFEKNIEFFLSAVIHVNENRIYNDGVYEYDSIGFPFMGNLGRVIFQYEKNRNRKFVPDLSGFYIH